MPMGAAWKLIGTLAHPSESCFGTMIKKNASTKGYGILQPRVANSLRMSPVLYLPVCTGNEPGIDPYTRAFFRCLAGFVWRGGFYLVKEFMRWIFQEVAQEESCWKYHSWVHDLLEAAIYVPGCVVMCSSLKNILPAIKDDIKRRSRWVGGIGRYSPGFCYRYPWRLSRLIGVKTRWRISANPPEPDVIRLLISVFDSVVGYFSKSCTSLNQPGT